MNKKQFLQFKKMGVIIINYPSVYIDSTVTIEPNTVIYPNNHIFGHSHIHKCCILFPNNIINNCDIGEACEVTSSVLKDSQFGHDCQIGPFAYIRPASYIGNNCRIGDFVEIKNSTVGDGTKVSHLAYIGDASVGRKCNIGCGSIFVNYDGKTKQHIEVGDNSFIGSNCNLIAPLTIGKKCYICAGTTVTKNIADKSFVIGRTMAIEKENRSDKYLE